MSLQPIKGNRRAQVDFGSATKNGAVTVASASAEETIRKSPIAPPIAKNQIKNSLFDADNHYPGLGGYGHNRSPESNNGTGTIWNYNKQPKDWIHFSPFYTNPTSTEYQTFIGNYFFNIRKNRQNVYEDMGSIHPPSSGRAGINTSNGSYGVGSAGTSRGIGLFGAGGYLNVRNNDPDRNCPDTAIVSCRNPNTAITSSSTWAGIKDDAWVKHSVQSSVFWPGAFGTSDQGKATVVKKVKYGAWVQVLETDDFNGKNFAAIELRQDYLLRGQAFDGTIPPPGNNAGGGDRGGVVNADRIFIKKAGQSIPDPNLDVTDVFDSNGLAGFYDRGRTYPHDDFLNPPHGQGGSYDLSTEKQNQNNVSPNYSDSFYWPTDGRLEGTTVNSSDYREFKKVEREVTIADYSAGLYRNSYFPEGALGSGLFNWSTRVLTLELCFYESISNLQSATSTTPTGSCRFFQPYVQFYDGNDNLMDQWWTYDTINDPNYTE